MRIQRIAILSVHASPVAAMGERKTGGMNIYIRKLSQELGRAGVLVDIYTRRTTAQQPDVDTSLGANVNVIYISAGGLLPLGPDDLYPHLSEFAAGVLTYTTRHNIAYNVIYSHYWLSGWVAHKLKEVWNIPFAHMFHTLGHMKNRIPSATADTPASQRMLIEARVATWADKIIAATPAEQAQLLWLYRANRRKIIIISPGVDIEQFSPVPVDVAKARIHMPSTQQLIVFAGRLEPLKAVDTVIRALSIIRDERKDLFETLKFLVIGGQLDNPEDSELASLQALVNTLGLQGSVEFLGAQEQATLRDYYAASVAAIMPSDYESFGMAALEAMASGTPVIASEVGGLSFLIRDGETGMHVPTREPAAMAQRIVYLLDHPAEATIMRTQAAATAHGYAWSIIADRLLQLFSTLFPDTSATHHKR